MQYTIPGTPFVYLFGVFTSVSFTWLFDFFSILTAYV